MSETPFLSLTAERDAQGYDVAVVRLFGFELARYLPGAVEEAFAFAYGFTAACKAAGRPVLVCWNLDWQALNETIEHDHRRMTLEDARNYYDTLAHDLREAETQAERTAIACEAATLGAKGVAVFGEGWLEY